MPFEGITGVAAFSVGVGGGGVCSSVAMVWKNGFVDGGRVGGNCEEVAGTVNAGWGGGCGGK